MPDSRVPARVSTGLTVITTQRKRFPRPIRKTANDVLVRAAVAGDQFSWQRLCLAYCEIYRTKLSARVLERTWQRILDPAAPINCVVAEVNTQLVGFAHSMLHDDAWSTQLACYVSDVFVAPDMRRQGAGKALITWLRNTARTEQWSCLHWCTETNNVAARALYAEFADDTEESMRYIIWGASGDDNGGALPPIR